MFKTSTQKIKTKITGVFYQLFRVNLGLTLKTSTIILATLAIYFQDLSIILFDAFYSEQNFHLLAVIPLVVYMLYRKRKIANALVNQDSKNIWKKQFQTFAGILLCVAALLIYWYGSYTFTPIEYHMATLPFFVAGLILILFNFDVLRCLIFPIAFLAFLTPPPAEVLYPIGSLLSNISAEASNAITNLFGVSSSLHYQYGSPIINVIRADQSVINFTVDIACSGIYSLVGFAIFSTFLAFALRKTTKSKIAILLTGIPIIIFLNTIRITIILLLGYHFGNELALQVFHTFGATILMFFGTLIFLLLMEKFAKNIIPSKPCLPCKNRDQNSKNNFCRYCGKIFKTHQSKLSKNDILKITIILVLVGVMVFVQVPVFALTEGPAQVIIQTRSGEEGNIQILPQIQDYELRYLYRDTNFEIISGQEASLAYKYSSNDSQKISVWVAVEVSSIRSSLHRWEVCLITWPLHEGVQPRVTQIELKDVQISENPPITARYFAFQRHSTNQTQVVLYWYETSIFTTNGTSQVKHVKMSLTTYLQNDQDIKNAEEQLLPVAQTINNYWQPIKTWSIFALGISQYGLSFSVAIVVLLFGIFLYYKYSVWEEKNRLTNLYNKISESNKQLSQALFIIQKNRKKNSPENIAEQFMRISNTPIDLDRLEKQLSQAQTLGLVKKVIVSRNDEPIIQWKNQIPQKVFNQKIGV